MFLGCGIGRFREALFGQVSVSWYLVGQTGCLLNGFSGQNPVPAVLPKPAHGILSEKQSRWYSNRFQVFVQLEGRGRHSLAFPTRDDQRAAGEAQLLVEQSHAQFHSNKLQQMIPF